MKIQAINTNTNFKGLFTNKSAQNGGNWLMEYRPYSWESNNTGKMDKKVHVDVLASKLPDNEEIFTRGFAHTESSQDILGTESYYKAADGTMRRTITEAPSMNREESLEVLDRKLAVFHDMKQKARRPVEDSFQSGYAEIMSASAQYDKASKAHQSSFLGKNLLRGEMDYGKACIMAGVSDMYKNATKYVQLMSSIDDVNAQRQTIQNEIRQIGELRKTGNLIDISRRDIINPNEALIQALKNMGTAVRKVVCMPDGLISMEAILNKLGNNTSAGEIIKFIEKRIGAVRI